NRSRRSPTTRRHVWDRRRRSSTVHAAGRVPLPVLRGVLAVVSEAATWCPPSAAGWPFGRSGYGRAMLRRDSTGDAGTAPPFRLASPPVLGWALYDFANTIFSFAVITQYFNAWIIEDKGRPDWHVGLMGFVVGLVLVVL